MQYYYYHRFTSFTCRRQQHSNIQLQIYISASILRVLNFEIYRPSSKVSIDTTSLKEGIHKFRCKLSRSQRRVRLGKFPVKQQQFRIYFELGHGFLIPQVQKPIAKKIEILVQAQPAKKIFLEVHITYVKIDSISYVEFWKVLRV